MYMYIYICIYDQYIHVLFSCGLLHVHGEILSTKHQTQQGLSRAMASHGGLRTCLSEVALPGFFPQKNGI